MIHPNMKKAFPATHTAESVRESLALAIENLEDVFSAHRDPESRDYNECEKPGDECQWCADARKGIDGIQYVMVRLESLERDREMNERAGCELLDHIIIRAAKLGHRVMPDEELRLMEMDLRNILRGPILGAPPTEERDS